MYSLGRRTPACALPSCSLLTYIPLLIGTGFLPDWPTAQRLACLVRLNIGVKGLHHSWKMQINFVYAHAYCVHVKPAYAVPVGAKEGVRPSGTEVVGTCERPVWKLGLRPGVPAKASAPPTETLLQLWLGNRVLTVRAALGTPATTFTGEYTFIGLAALSPIFDLCIVGIVLDP